MSQDIQHLMRPGTLTLTSLPPLSLYVHLPWCLKKCPYCDFNSHEVRGTAPEADYIAALVADLEAALPLIWGRSVQSIFIGGGTPSLFSPAGIERLIGSRTATAGMIAKLRACEHALNHGVGDVVIVDGRDPAALESAAAASAKSVPSNATRLALAAHG